MNYKRTRTNWLYGSSYPTFIRNTWSVCKKIKETLKLKTSIYYVSKTTSFHLFSVFHAHRVKGMTHMKETHNSALKWKIWTLFNNWFSVINNLKIFYKESQTQYFTNFASFQVFFYYFFNLYKKNQSGMNNKSSQTIIWAELSLQTSAKK